MKSLIELKNIKLYSKITHNNYTVNVIKFVIKQIHNLLHNNFVEQ